MPLRALVRPPAHSYVRCLRSDTSREIDLARARAQHRGYCRALRACGATLVRLPPDPVHPDACFVEDAAVVIGGDAIITRPGAESRRGETPSVERVLARTHRIHHIERGFIDGGDVLVAGNAAFVGLSARTDRHGAAELRGILKPMGVRVRTVPVNRLLHLKSGATPIGDDTILQLAGAFPAGTFRGFRVVESDDLLGGNALAIDRHMIVSTAAPRTADRLVALGFDVHLVDLGEFHAGDSGVTCLSVMLPKVGNDSASHP